ncbi:HTH-type transcriptional regulator PuuR [Leminorella richardii]|uniref:HTH-type transcriptional regulator PuuR n=1 Tax=Leminorella richardii TaxID=158841 RepID=A0A2X4V0N8_9GAMM|nr:helix-turn-helix domain-containing protein [Leminorella richardii]SQI41708.1 HTH-type transcriptional regulator PuuR [Leminorella richardii]
MSELTNFIGERLRSARQERGWSLDKMAEISQVSKAMLGQIERGESNPTVLTLWKIATGFQIPFSAFLPNQTAEDKDLTLASGQEVIEAKSIQPFDPVLGYEILLIALRPGGYHASCAHEEGVIEDVMPISDSVVIEANGVSHTVAPMASLRFNASREHSYANPSADVVHFYNVVHYPSRRK